MQKVYCLGCNHEMFTRGPIGNSPATGVSREADFQSDSKGRFYRCPCCGGKNRVAEVLGSDPLQIKIVDFELERKD